MIASLFAATAAFAQDTTAPTAVLDAPNRLEVGAALTLRGNRSSDIGGKVIRYEWTRLTGSGGTMNINQPVQTTSSSFTVPQSSSNPLAVGQHRFQLRVVDDSGNQSAPAVMNVLVADSVAPTAVLDAPNRLNPGQALTLRGNRSTDIGGSVVRYEWTRLSGSGGTMNINQPVQTTSSSFTVPQSSATPLAVGQHRFQLRVVDDSGNQSAPAVINVIVADSVAPTAVLDAPNRLSPGQALTLRGNRSTDIGGNIIRYEWTRLSGSGGTMNVNQPVTTTASSFTVPQSSATPLAVGKHRFQLRVVDDSGNQSAPAVINVIVADTVAPTAVLDAPNRLSPGQALTLRGNRSSDIGGKIIRYEWTRLNGSGGTMNVNQPVTTTASSFTVPQSSSNPLAVGQQRFQLRVTDNSGNQSAPAVMNVIVADTVAPMAVLAAPSVIDEGKILVLHGTRSSDIGGRIVKYRWTRIGGKTVETASARVSFPEKLAPGVHRFQLMVTDDSGNMSKPAISRVSVRAVDRDRPVAVFSAPRRVAFLRSFHLSAAGSKDATGRVVLYRWTRLSGRGGSLAAGKSIETKTPALRLVQPGKDPMLPGSHRFRLQVIDDSGNISRPAERTILVEKPVVRPR